MALTVAGLQLIGEAKADGLWHFSATPAQTAEVPEGHSGWMLIAQSVFSDDREVIKRGPVTVIATDTTTAGDQRSWAERTLEAVEAVLSNSATLTQRRYQIGNRSLDRTPVAELLDLRTRLRAEVGAERAAAAGGSAIVRKHLVRFT
ncbi:hypothetical protein [uncultured Paracoccus sp.]|uniref:hypothetical protein n=1 Tax=uncultured Paracoccus sp. TaxID=189685 RepID=UPI0025D963F1|nr:hypothetical protein [uncultured Paracoccus sp.]